MPYNFPVTRTTHPKPRPEDETKLGFARFFTDHMFVMEYDEGQGWHDGRIVPHEPFLIEPVKSLAHLIHSSVGINHNCFRSLEYLLLFQFPVKS